MALGLCIVCRGSRKVEIHTLLYTYIYTHTHLRYLFMLCLLHRKCWGANIPIGLYNVIIKFKMENIKERKPIISAGGHGAMLYGPVLLRPEKRHRLSKRVWPDCTVNMRGVKGTETEKLETVAPRRWRKRRNSGPCRSLDRVLEQKKGSRETDQVCKLVSTSVNFLVSTMTLGL